MKLLIAAVTFATTLGMLFLIETGKSPKEDYARIIETLKNGDASTATSAMPSPIKTQTLAPTPALTPASTFTPTPASTLAPTPARTSTPSPTPPPAGLQPSSAPSETPMPTPTPPAAAAPSPTPTADHVFYTSRLAYPRSKYIYCDTDKNWKDLVNPLSFATLDAALSSSPNKTLHEPCK